MGSYGNLLVGKLEVGSWKSWVPLEPSLLFEKPDAWVGKSDVDDEPAFFGFRTTAAIARNRLEIRSLTVEFCRRFFEEFRSDILHQIEPTTFKSKYVTNSFTFEDYLSFLKESLKAGSVSLWNRDGNVAPAVSEDKAPPDDLFSNEAEYFDDAMFLVQLRLIVEVAPADASVELYLGDLKDGGYLPTDDLPELLDHWSRLLRRRVEVTAVQLST